MAKVYIKKVQVVNTTYFKKLNIDPSKLSLSQRNHTDRLITLLKPASNKFFKEGIWQLVKDFVELTNGKDRKFVQNAFISIENQINNEIDGKEESKKEYKFSIQEYSHCELIGRLVEVIRESRPSVVSEEEIEAAKRAEEAKIESKRNEILFNPWRSSNKEEHDEYVRGLSVSELDKEITYQDYCKITAEEINSEQGITNTKWELNGFDVWKMEQENLEVKDILNLKKR